MKIARNDLGRRRLGANAGSGPRDCAASRMQKRGRLPFALLLTHRAGMSDWTPGSSRCEVTHLVMPGQTNGVAGVLFGGIMMQWIDVCAGVSAMRHAGGSVVTASIDRLDFLVPVRVGDIVVLQSKVNFTHRSSMEVGVRVEVEDPKTRSRLYTTKAYLTFVAMDENNRPRKIPELVVEHEIDLMRFQAAKHRREERLKAAGRAN